MPTRHSFNTSAKEVRKTSSNSKSNQFKWQRRNTESCWLCFRKSSSFFCTLPLQILTLPWWVIATVSGTSSSHLFYSHRRNRDTSLFSVLSLSFYRLSSRTSKISTFRKGKQFWLCWKSISYTWYSSPRTPMTYKYRLSSRNSRITSLFPWLFWRTSSISISITALKNISTSTYPYKTE